MSRKRLYTNIQEPVQYPPDFTDEKLEQYVKDPLLFRKEQWVMGQSHLLPRGGLFGQVCQPWQAENIFKPIDKRTRRGFPKYNLLYIQISKKLGKTTILSGECINQLLLSPFLSEENYLLGGDKNQAAYLFNHTVKFIQRNPNLESLFKIYKEEIVVISTGARLIVLSSEAATKQGKNPDFFIFDEFWNQPDRNLWDTMWLGMAAKPHGKGIIITNAGYDTNSICYNIREMCRSKKFPKYYHYEPVGEALESLTAPWIEQEWVDMERASLPPNVFRRFRLNLWTSEGEAPFMPDEGWDCFKAHLNEKVSCNSGFHVLGIDFGYKKDLAGAVLVHRNKGKIVVDQIRQWKGSSKVPIPIREVEGYIAEVIRNFSDVEIVADPWQMIGTLQKFQHIGIKTEEFYHTIQNIVKLSKNLYYLLKNIALEIPRHGALEQEMKGLQVLEKSYGWRIDHEGGGASDLSIALGMASLKAMEKALEDDEIGDEIGDMYFLDKSSIYKSGGKDRTFGDTIEIFEKPDSDMDDSPRISLTSRMF
jgi:phage terminase large subunit-like protein